VTSYQFGRWLVNGAISQKQRILESGVRRSLIVAQFLLSFEAAEL
jgi:hypothetical protein